MGALGVFASSGTIIVNSTALTGVGYPVGALQGTVKTAAGVKLAFSDTAGALKTYYDSSLLPATTDVRLNTSYGGGDFVGSMASGKGFVYGG
jgi:hypothetical protein